MRNLRTIAGLVFILGIALYVFAVYGQARPPSSAPAPAADSANVPAPGSIVDGLMTVRYEGTVLVPKDHKEDPAYCMPPNYCDPSSGRAFVTLDIGSVTEISRITLTGSLVNWDTYDGKRVELTGTTPATSEKVGILVNILTIRELPAR